MDLNDLYHRYGVALLMARNAACSASRDAHREMAAAYAGRIAGLRADPALVAA